MTTTQKTYAIHDICNDYPEMSNNDLQELGEDIAAHGLYEPITLFEGQILDGRNRYLAAQRVGYAIPEEKFQTFDPDTQGNPVEFVISRNHFRRHMSDDARIAVYMKLRARLEETAKERKAKHVGDANRTRSNKANVSNGDVQEDTQPTGKSSRLAAKGAGISSGQAARLDFIKAHGPEELVTAVLEKKTTVNAAYKKAQEYVKAQQAATTPEKEEAKIVPFPKKEDAQLFADLANAQREVEHYLKQYIGILKRVKTEDTHVSAVGALLKAFSDEANTVARLVM